MPTYYRNLDLAFVTLLTASTRILVCILGINDPGDADARLVTAAKWASDPYLIYSGVWLPFHYYAMGTLMFVIHDPLVAGKTLSFALGTLTVIPFFFLTELLFDRKTAFVGGIFFAIYGNHVGLSAVTMSEAPFGFLSVCALYIFVKNIQSGAASTKGFLWSALLLALAGGFRQEAWHVTGILGIILLFQPETRKLAVPFCLVGLSTYFLWTIGNMLDSHDALFSLTGVGQAKSAEQSYSERSVAHNAVKWIWIFVQSPGPIISALSVLGMYFQIRSRSASIILILIALLFLGPYILISLFRAEWTPQHRYTFLFGILILPFAAKALAEFFNTKPALNISMVVVVLASITSQAAAYARHNHIYLPFHDYVPASVDAWQWLYANIDNRDVAIVEDYEWNVFGIVYNSGLYKRRYAVVYQGDRNNGVLLRKIVEDQCPTIVIIRRDSTANWKFLEEGYSVTRMYVNDIFVISRLKYKEAAGSPVRNNCFQ